MTARQSESNEAGLRLSGEPAVARPVARTEPRDRRLAGWTERSLIDAARSGDHHAFGELVRRHEANLIAFLRRRCRPRIDEEDLAQDVFLRAWSALDQFEPGRPLKPWLFTIAARHAVSTNRRDRFEETARERKASQPAAGSGEQADAPDRSDVDRVWEVAEACLSEEALQAMWLRYAEDMSPRDIARVLGRSPVHVRVMISRARKRVRSQMEQLDARTNGVGEAES